MVIVSKHQHLKRKNKEKEDFQLNHQEDQNGLKNRKEQIVFCSVINALNLFNKPIVVSVRVRVWFFLWLFADLKFMEFGFKIEQQ